MALIVTTLASISENTSVHAATPNNYVKTVYVDGVKFNVSINDNYEIEVAGHTDTSDAFLLVNQNGIGNLSIDNDSLIAESADYKLDIENLSMTDADVDIYENGIKTDEISSVEEIFEDNYDGQVSIVAGGVTITVGMVLEAMVAALLAVVISEVLFIVVTKFYSKVQEAAKEKREKVKKYYFKAAIWNGQVVVAPKAISKSKAVARVKANQSIYSFTASMAKSIINQAGYRYSPAEIDGKRYKGHVYLWHYHKANKKGHAIHDGGFHSFYGAPVVGTL